MTSTATTDIFAQEIAAGVEFFTGGKDNFDFNPLTNIEELAVQKAWGKNIAFLNMICPPLAAQFMDKTVSPATATRAAVVAGHGTAMVKFAGIAKAIFPENKAITFPGEPGTIVADWLTPQTAFWAAGVASYASAGGDIGAYSDKAGSTAGATGYRTHGMFRLLLELRRTFSETRPGSTLRGTTNEAHSLGVLAQNGLIEDRYGPKVESYCLPVPGAAEVTLPSRFSP